MSVRCFGNPPPPTWEAYNLMHEGLLTLGRMDAAGVKVDVDYLNKTIRSTEKRIKALQNDIEDTKEYRKWRKKYGSKLNLESRKQLNDILFNEMGFPRPSKKTVSGNDATDNEVLSEINTHFSRTYIAIAKLEKLLSTYFYGIRNELCSGFVHPSFLLNMIVTYRSSCKDPNFQNIPNRDREIAELIRRCYIARKKGWVLGEFDFSQIEVRIGCAYHKDPNMIRYVKDKSRDMHRDTAMEIFMLAEKEISKPVRHIGKNKFVFPQFYGDWFASCGKNIWKDVQNPELKTASGVSIKKHLKGKGITELGECGNGQQPDPDTFLAHLQKIERLFWKERFAVYASWKDTYWEEFLERGWLKMLTGFVVSGVFKKNEVVNSPIQGTSFHMTLWSAIEIEKELRRRRLKTLLIAEIHDSILTDGPEEEFDEVAEICENIMTKKLVRNFDWINVPIEIEIERGRPGGSWFEKKEYKKAA